MTTGGRQDFALFDKPVLDKNEVYIPPKKWTAPGPPRWEGRVSISVIGQGTDGRYSVHVGGHDPFAPYQAQVVAYGLDNARCKFSQPSVADYKDVAGGLLRGWYSRFYVLCLDGGGRPVNSSFIFSFSGSPRHEDSSWARPLAPPPQDAPKAAFLETTEFGTAIARCRQDPASPTPPSVWPTARSGTCPPD